MLELEEERTGPARSNAAKGKESATLFGPGARAKERGQLVARGEPHHPDQGRREKKGVINKLPPMHMLVE